MFHGKSEQLWFLPKYFWVMFLLDDVHANTCSAVKLLWSLIYSTCYNHRGYTLEITSTNLNEVYIHACIYNSHWIVHVHYFHCHIFSTFIACACICDPCISFVVCIRFTILDETRVPIMYKCTCTLFVFCQLYTLVFLCVIGSLVMEHLGSSPSPIQGKPILYGSVHGAVGTYMYIVCVYMNGHVWFGQTDWPALTHTRKSSHKHRPERTLSNSALALLACRTWQLQLMNKALPHTGHDNAKYTCAAQKLVP